MMLDSEPQVMEIADMSPSDATEMLSLFCENGFHGSVEEAALVLGRPEEELRRMLDGIEEIDEDLIMKVRGISQERGIDIGIQLPDDNDAGGVPADE
jgi:hypothetical protein